MKRILLAAFALSALSAHAVVNVTRNGESALYTAKANVEAQFTFNVAAPYECFTMQTAGVPGSVSGADVYLTVGGKTRHGKIGPTSTAKVISTGAGLYTPSVRTSVDTPVKVKFTALKMVVPRIVRGITPLPHC